MVSNGLSLIQILNIAIVIARGMEYLHHHCFVQVIHCDLKLSSVLLDKYMIVYLIDFGIASICFLWEREVEKKRKPRMSESLPMV